MWLANISLNLSFFKFLFNILGAFLVAQLVKNLLAMETLVRFLSDADMLEKG